MSREIFAEVISTGSEMMLGRLVDTNSAWLSDILNSVGIKVARHTSVGDDLPRIVKAFKRAWDEHSVIVATGGLGPTEDDLTRQAAAQAFGMELEYHEELAEDLRRMFARHGYTLTENNMRQAWLPKGSIMAPNPNGTAPGFAIFDENHLMVFLPGVPMEMKHMVKEWFLPQLRERFPAAGGLSKTVILKTAGLGESNLDSIIGDLVTPDGNPEIGMLAAPDMVRVLVTARGATEEAMEAALAPAVAELEKRLDGHVFGYGETTLAEAVAAQLEKLGLRLYIMDAATQGRLSGFLSPALAPENWSGTVELPNTTPLVEKPDVDKPDEVTLFVTSRPDPDAPEMLEGQIAVIISITVWGDAINDGLPVPTQIHLGGASHRALSRAAALSAFHLWRTLRRLSV